MSTLRVLIVEGYLMQMILRMVMQEMVFVQNALRITKQLFFLLPTANIKRLVFFAQKCAEHKQKKGVETWHLI